MQDKKRVASCRFRVAGKEMKYKKNSFSFLVFRFWFFVFGLRKYKAQGAR